MEVIAAVLAGIVVILVVVLIMVLRRPVATADLKQASEHLLTLAEQRLQLAAQAGAADLGTKKELIDQQVKAVKEELEKVTNLVRGLETDRQAKFSEITTQIKTLGEQTVGLTAATSTLREALANPQRRGQWGERMADDILRLAGFIEGVNYLRQATIEGAGSRPDYVFLLPKGLRLNMDVKFPWQNYFRALEASSDAEREACERDFLRDVRNKVKEITSREYIDPEGGTTDCVILFIPNDTIYAFVHQADSALLDDALRNRVVCCSPLTLFAVLQIVRQAVDNFALQKASSEILSHLGRFKVEWQKFTKSLKTLGNRLTSVQRAYEEVAGPRKHQLERPLAHIEALRLQQQLEVAPTLEDETLVLPEAEEPDDIEDDTS